MEVVGAVGLRNQGSTCFMNSVLQCLTHTPQLAKFILSSEKLKGPVACDFLQLVKAIWDPNFNGGSLIPGSKLMGKYHLGQQQDSHEYLMFLLDALNQELKCKTGSSPIADMFEGQIKSTVKCPKCSTVVKSGLETFMTLSLPVPECHDSAPVSLDSCLAEIARDEVVDSWDCSKCKKKAKKPCKTPSQALKKFEMTKLPSNLILHLTRMKWDSAGIVNKSETAVEFPDKLHCFGQQYKLHGVIEHVGNAEYGHYTATVRLDCGAWYKFDDETVENVEPPSCSNDVYILFYCK